MTRGFRGTGVFLGGELGLPDVGEGIEDRGGEEVVAPDVGLEGEAFGEVVDQRESRVLEEQGSFCHEGRGIGEFGGGSGELDSRNGFQSVGEPCEAEAEAELFIGEGRKTVGEKRVS